MKMYVKQLFSFSLSAEISAETTFGRLLARTFTVGSTGVVRYIFAIGLHLTAKLSPKSCRKTYLTLPCPFLPLPTLLNDGRKSPMTHGMT
jgi:hypothetical protein